MEATIINSKGGVAGKMTAKAGMVDHTRTWRIIKTHSDHADVESYDGNWSDVKHTFIITQKEARRFGWGTCDKRSGCEIH